MPIVYQLIKTLNPFEVEQVSRLPFQERERAVFNKMLQLKSSVFPSSTVCKNLSIQPSHLDKINSILLKKSIELLAGTNVYDQVHYFDQKNGLWKASERTLRQHDQKVILLSDNAEEKYIFYKFCFEWILSNSASDNQEKYIQYYTEGMVNNCPKHLLKETELWIRISLLRKEINESTMQAMFNNPVKQNTLFTKLNTLLQQAEELEAPLCIFKAKLNAILLNNMIRNFTGSIKAITDIELLFTIYPKSFTETDVFIAQWHYAQILFFSSQFEESLKIYESLKGKINKRDTAKWYVYMAEYFQVCLITKNYLSAGEICMDFFSRFLEDRNGRFYLSSLIQDIKFLIHTQQNEAALKKLNELHKNMPKNASLQFHFALRELTLAYHYLTNHFTEALILAEKNLKFMRAKKIHQLIPEYTYHSRLVKSIIKNKQKNIPLDNEELHMLHTLQQGTMAQYGVLLLRLMQG